MKGRPEKRRNGEFNLERSRRSAPPEIVRTSSSACDGRSLYHLARQRSESRRDFQDRVSGSRRSRIPHLPSGFQNLSPTDNIQMIRRTAVQDLYNQCTLHNFLKMQANVGLSFTFVRLEVLREHRPPPNASIIELWQFFPDPDRDPERTPGSG